MYFCLYYFFRISEHGHNLPLNVENQMKSAVEIGGQITSLQLSISDITEPKVEPVSPVPANQVFVTTLSGFCFSYEMHDDVGKPLTLF